MLCNISQNAVGQPGGGYPARSSRGWGGTLLGGGGDPGRGVPYLGTPPRPDLARSGQGGGAGGTQLGQQKEYSLHGGRYASCVHAGGLSCYICVYMPFLSWSQVTFYIAKCKTLPLLFFIVF